MLLGIAIIWHLTGTFTLSDVKLEANTSLAAAAFLCLAIGAFAKAGAMPLHTWIPDSSEVAPVSVMAYLPASLDKLLGIYLLARISLDIFSVRPNSPVSVFLLVVGAVTIIAAVMMALVQHNLKRLLAYHAVSQVGYMVLGIGTANPIGIAGGLFHMVNNAIYKSCLFLSGGSVEKAAGTTELDRLGGLAHVMPITFATCLIASLSISGVPPFNGFFSKWMIYQGLVEMGKSGSRLWVVWLCVAMFGSALTLASFIKLLFSVFLSPRDPKEKGEADSVGEAPASMWIPQAALAVMCVIFGIFAYRLPIRYFIEPSLAAAGATISWSGIWNAPLAAILLLAGLCAGAVFFAVGKMAPIRRSSTFMGGEVLADRSGIKGTAFYNTIKELPVIGALYKLADKKVFDIYEEGSKGTFFLSGILQWLHNGVLPTYVVWCLIGMLLLFITFAR
jgi:formate hydrogenlyase subunit 3/multisubunit Na+/H+ antiporter MnhD subunit